MNWTLERSDLNEWMNNVRIVWKCYESQKRLTASFNEIHENKAKKKKRGKNKPAEDVIFRILKFLFRINCLCRCWWYTSFLLLFEYIILWITIVFFSYIYALEMYSLLVCLSWGCEYELNNANDVERVIFMLACNISLWIE